MFSARWAVLIAGMTPPVYTDNKAAWLSLHDVSELEGEGRSIVQLGQGSTSAARWWSAVLASSTGWMVARLHEGDRLLSPWSIQLDQDRPIYLTKYTSSQDDIEDLPPSFEMAITYIRNYCCYHDIADVNQAAVTAALLLLLTNLEKRSIPLLRPQFNQSVPKKHCGLAASVWNNENHLDRLLTLSCNSMGIRATIGSIFY